VLLSNALCTCRVPDTSKENPARFDFSVVPSIVKGLSWCLMPQGLQRVNSELHRARRGCKPVVNSGPRRLAGDQPKKPGDKDAQAGNWQVNGGQIGTSTQIAMTCLSTSWAAHESELRSWLRHRLANVAEADDLMQDLFLKALRQGERFCSVQNARAWLFEVARNTLSDHLRVARNMVELPDDLVAPADEMDTVDSLTACLPRVLGELSLEDREAIMLCDLQGLAQADYARLKDLSLSAAKSRIQRARKRLRDRMTLACQVQIDAAGRVSDFVPRR